MTVKIFTNMPFPRFHIFNKKCMFKTIADNVVNSWNSSSIIILVFTNFSTLEVFYHTLRFSVFDENGGKMHFYPLNSSNTENQRVWWKTSKVEKLVNTNTIILAEFQEFITLSDMVLNMHILSKIWNLGSAVKHFWFYHVANLMLNPMIYIFFTAPY